jgi:hypothetical protein
MVPANPCGHADVEEVAVAVEEAAEVGVVLPVSVVLSRLHEGDVRVGEVGRGRPQPPRMGDVVGVDDGDHLDLGGEPPRRLVEGAGLEARPGLQVHELEARTELAADRLQRPPHLRIGGVVVHHLHDVGGVVEAGQGLEGAAHDVDGLVVGGHLDGDEGGRSHRGRGWRRPAPAQDVEHLEGVGQAQAEGHHLEEEQEAGGEEEDRAVALGDGEGRGIGEVAAGGHQESGEEEGVENRGEKAGEGEHGQAHRNSDRPGRRRGAAQQADEHRER